MFFINLQKRGVSEFQSFPNMVRMRKQVWWKYSKEDVPGYDHDMTLIRTWLHPWVKRRQGRCSRRSGDLAAGTGFCPPCMPGWWWWNCVEWCFCDDDLRNITDMMDISVQKYWQVVVTSLGESLILQNQAYFWEDLHNLSEMSVHKLAQFDRVVNICCPKVSFFLVSFNYTIWKFLSM